MKVGEMVQRIAEHSEYTVRVELLRSRASEGERVMWSAAVLSGYDRRKTSPDWVPVLFAEASTAQEALDLLMEREWNLPL